MSFTRLLCAPIALAVGMGCSKKPADDSAAAAPAAASPAPTPAPPGGGTAGAPAAAFADRDWVLAMLGDRPAGTGGGGRPATIRFDAAAHRVSGFAGCNRFSGDYTQAGDSLTFSPLISTKMACTEGDQLERDYLGALGKVKMVHASDTALTLTDGAAPLARFRPQ
jgi:heat shock protein HslJ